MFQSERGNLVENVVHTVPGPRPRTGKGLVFHLAYKVMEGEETIARAIDCDLTAPASLVISMAGAITDVGNYVSIIVGPDDRREWFCHRIIYAKFGFAL
jgi:hypothetical protein